MGKDKNTIQTKARNLKHECGSNHDIKHVNAQRIAEQYQE